MNPETEAKLMALLTDIENDPASLLTPADVVATMFTALFPLNTPSIAERPFAQFLAETVKPPNHVGVVNWEVLVETLEALWDRKERERNAQTSPPTGMP